MTPQEIEALRMEALKDKVESLLAMVEILKAERDALAAQVEALSDALKSGVRLMRTTGQYSGWHEKADEAESLINQELTSQQCLRDVQAEAGRAGFIEGVRQKVENELGRFGNDVQSSADQYAAKVRQSESGTWLKDSNVNGGKRQGGE